MAPPANQLLKEPAQLQACQAHLSRTLVDIISGPRLYQCRAFLNIICKIFGLLVTQGWPFSLHPWYFLDRHTDSPSPEAEIPLADPATPHYLLQLAANPEMSLDGEEFCILASVALAYLAYEPFQEELIRRSGVQALLSAFSDSFTKYDIGEMDPDDVEEFKSLGNRFMHVIADVVALPSFLPQYPLNSHAVQTLRVWVANSFNITSLQTAGCIALGNLARSDQSSIYFVHDVKIHIPLIKLLSNPYAALQLPSETTPDGIPPSSQLIYAVLSFLKNLAIPAANKPMLGTLLDPPASILPRLWNSTDAQPQVQFAAVSLARLLLLNCPANVRKICTPLSTDASSPAHDRSNLHVLISLFKRTDAENTKTEAARAVVAVCRVLHTSPDADSILPEDWEPTEDASIYSGSTHTNTNSAFSSSEPSPNTMNSTGPVSDMDETITAPPSIVTPAPGASYQLRRARFCNAHMDMSDCFGYLMTQERFPVLRSEIWFVSAILSRSTDGAHLVLRALQPFEACRMLVEAVTGRDLVEGHRLPGGESLLSDDELLSMANATGAVAPSALAVGNASGADVQAPFGLPHESASAVEPTATAGASGGVEGLGLEPQQADPAQAASMARADHENGLVLISEIMKNYSHFQPPFRRGVFEQILQSGGALVMYASTEAEQSAK